MDFVFYSHPTFEPWDWTNPETVGIGGSETSQWLGDSRNVTM